MDVPTPASLCVHFPVKMSMWPPTRPSFDRRDQMAFAARSASCLNWLSGGFCLLSTKLLSLVDLKGSLFD